MAFFILLPFFWLAGILLLGASPRQQLVTARATLCSKPQAYTYLALTCAASLGWLMYAGHSLIISLICLILLLMLCVPAPVLLLSHRPRLVLPSLVAAAVIGALMQWGA